MADDATTNQGYGQQDPSDSADEHNARDFHILARLARVSTLKLVKVMAVDTDAFTVDVQIMVNQLDGQNNSTPHGTINAVPYLYFQCGNGAIIADPVIGDKGLMGCCDRDISAVLATKDIANPGSFRKLSAMDGVYICGLPGINGAAEQFIKFTSTGIEWQDKNSNTITSGASGISINGLVINQSGQVAGPLPVTGALELGGSIEALSGGEYAGDITTSGTVFAADVKSGAGATLVTLRGHEHTANNTPPNPGH